MMFLMICQ